MKISRHWLQTLFVDPLPSTESISDALTFHVFEIDGIERNGDDDIFDVKVTADRGHDCLSHRGIAKELSAILDKPLKEDPLRKTIELLPATDEIAVVVDDGRYSARYIAGYIKGVKVGPSPEWLKQSLESIGQRSINNVVDAGNFVMFNIGQPLHAFDAQKFAEGERKAINVRLARDGEKITTLDNKEYTLPAHAVVIADHNSDEALAIAGIKGGKAAEVNPATTDLILEAAHFDGVVTRKTSQALKLRTDASARYEQMISPELAAHGMRAFTDLILQIAGGELVGFVDVYPQPAKERRVGVSVEHINTVLGTEYGAADIARAFGRLDLPFEQKEGDFAVKIPFERLDLSIPEDLVEDAVRIIGYDKVPAVELPPIETPPSVNKNYYWIERIREFLATKGFAEVYISVFTKSGERAVLNRVESDTPHLRVSLSAGLALALDKNARNADLLGSTDTSVFEIGTVFEKDRERMHLVLGIAGGKKSPKADATLTELGVSLGVEMPAVAGDSRVAEIDLSELLERLPDVGAYENHPLSSTERYKTFSKYPFIARDIALWVPSETDPEIVLSVIRENAGDLLVESRLFDRFEKEGKLSLAFRLVFQSFDKTLTDAEVNSVMEKVQSVLKGKGFEIR